MVAGQAIYRDQCSACHSLDGRGVPQLFPSLADSSMARSSDPTTLIRMILRGARSVATPAEPTAPGMPSFGWQLDDAQVAAVVTYIRNAWGSAAAPVSVRDVSRARSDLQGRTD
jgi:mono/diheme cytochrome c family protein